MQDFDFLRANSHFLTSALPCSYHRLVIVEMILFKKMVLWSQTNKEIF